MKCVNCQTESSHIHIGTDGTFSCHACGGWSETSGSATDKILTRNAARITEQQVQHEADIQTPYIIDKSTNQVVPNQDFIDLYPNQAAETYTDEELKSVGQSDLKASVEQDDGQRIEFSGDETTTIKEIIES